MTDEHRQRPTHDGLPLYAPGGAPPYLYTEGQLRSQFGLTRGSKPCRAYVESQHGPAALFLITEAEVVDHRPELGL